MKELNQYYQDKEKRNIKLVACWSWAVVISLVIGVWCLVAKGCYCWFYH